MLSSCVSQLESANTNKINRDKHIARAQFKGMNLLVHLSFKPSKPQRRIDISSLINIVRPCSAYCEVSVGRNAEEVLNTNQRDVNQDLLASKKVWTMSVLKSPVVFTVQRCRFVCRRTKSKTYFPLYHNVDIECVLAVTDQGKFTAFLVITERFQECSYAFSRMQNKLNNTLLDNHSI